MIKPHVHDPRGQGLPDFLQREDVFPGRAVPALKSQQGCVRIVDPRDLRGDVRKLLRAVGIIPQGGEKLSGQGLLPGREQGEGLVISA